MVCPAPGQRAQYQRLACFAYGSLFDHAHSKGLSTQDRKLFDGTRNFERALSDLTQARPLLVTEGSAVEKLRAIEGNRYLAHALQRLRDVDLPIVIFGSSLSAQDDHLVETLNEQPDRPVAVSMLPGPKKDLATRQAEIFGRLETESLVFFDATTHVLGSPALRAR